MKKFTIISLGVIALLMAAVAITYYFYRPEESRENLNDNENQVACTQEAFLCPDGSYVGRHGDKCAFDLCPNAGPFTGKLEQVSSGFRLLMNSPDKTGPEVSYSLPLEIKVSNVLGQFINQRVEVFGVFIKNNVFKVDRLENAPITDATLGEVGVGKTTFVNGARITLNKVVQDSRCPVDVQCIQAGSVTANISLKSDTDSETINIESGKSPIQFDSFFVSLENIAPSKVASHELDPQSYILTFKVIPS